MTSLTAGMMEFAGSYDDESKDDSRGLTYYLSKKHVDHQNQTICK